MPSISPAFRRLVSLPSVLLLSAVALLLPGTQAHAQTTTFSGTVYSPFGTTVNAQGYKGDPIPNILVFVQDTVDAQGALPTFRQGVTVPPVGTTGCDAQQNLLPGTSLGSGLTGGDGTFSFSVATALPDPVVIVIQAGKWRRVYSYPRSQFTVGGNNPGLVLVMPSAQQGPAVAGGPNIADLPHIAVVTGAADAVECIFSQIGISNSEITDPTGTGSINLFPGDGKNTGQGSGGGTGFSSTSPKESKLLNGSIPITNYDLVMFGCQGDPTLDPDPKNTTGNNPNYKTLLSDYANESGRVLLTHYEWPFLANTTAFAPVATWYATSVVNNTQNVTGVLNTAYEGYPTLDSWLSSIGALTSTNPAELIFPNTRQDVSSLSSTAQVWATIPSFKTTGSQAVQFSFDTPIGTTGTPSVAVTFTNNSTSFVQGDTSDSITMTVTNSGTVDTSGPALTMTINLPTAMTNPTLADSSGGTWSCSVSGAVSTCLHALPLAAGTSDSVLLTFGISTSATPGQQGVTATFSGGNLDNSKQCGRVLYNDYHVEASKTIPNGGLYSNGQYCTAVPSTGLNAAQKFLEYSLYALSNFVTPSGTDILLIQGASKLTWTPTQTTFYYGTPYTPNAALDNASSVIAGSFVYTADSTINPLDVGQHTITATFTPSDPDYVSSFITRPITILSDPTSSALTINGTLPTFFYGQPLAVPGGLSAAVNINVVNPGYLPQIVNAGAYNITVDGSVACTGMAAGANTCGSPTIATLDAGTHNVQLNYAGTTNTDFLPSSSTLYPVTIAPDPTTTALAASTTASLNLQAITFTATVSDAYALAVGPVIFYDSTTTASPAGNAPVGSPIGTVALDANGKAALTTTTVFTGTHYISACFTPAQNSLHNYNYVLSCSASTKVVVTTTVPADPAATFTLVTSSANPSAVGQAVSFTATVATSGNFISIPTGVVTFYDGSATLFSTQLAADGTAVFTTSALAIGSHPITVVYAGNTVTAKSTSTVLMQVVNSPLPTTGTGFLMLLDSTGVNVPIGSSAAISVRIIELNNFNQVIKLTCSGLPAESACNFATDTIPAAGGTTQMTVSASAPHDCNSGAQYFVSPAGETGLLALATLTLCLARKRRKLQGLALAVILCLLPAVLTGCGSGCTDFGVKPGTYTFTITATSAGSPAVVQTQTMTMNAHL